MVNGLGRNKAPSDCIILSNSSSTLNPLVNITLPLYLSLTERILLYKPIPDESGRDKSMIKKS
jgi:hypothetical protein